MDPVPWGQFPWIDEPVPPADRRVIVDNDFAGDPDDLFQLAHHLLCPSVDIAGIIGSHLAPGDPFAPGTDTATQAVARVHELLDVIGLDAADRVWLGAEHGLTDRATAIRSQGAERIVAEAMRTGADTPLFVAAGGGLTDVASAWLIEPRISERVQVIWIGGPELPGTTPPPPGSQGPEYNLRIDRVAAQVVLDDSDLPLWVVPRDVYRQCLVSFAELRTRVRPHGPLGRLLYDAVARVRDLAADAGMARAETYALGDSPLVLLTALQAAFEPDPSSSRYVEVSAPRVADDGSLRLTTGARPVRVYQQVDTRLMFEDLYAKFAEHAAWSTTEQA